MDESVLKIFAHQNKKIARLSNATKVALLSGKRVISEVSRESLDRDRELELKQTNFEREFDLKLNQKSGEIESRIAIKIRAGKKDIEDRLSAKIDALSAPINQASASSLEAKSKADKAIELNAQISEEIGVLKSRPLPEKGDPGPPGPPGINGKDGTNASLLTGFKGPWDARTEYFPGDTFTFRGAWYLVLRKSLNQMPNVANQRGSNPLYSILAAAGAPGPAGRDGRDGSGSGTVTSVGLSLPNIFSVTGSPVSTAGTLTASLATQAKNLVLAGPSSGVDAAPTFRALVAADIPDISGTYLTKTNNLSDVSSKSTAYDNLSPLTTLGDLPYGGANGTGTRLAGNTTSTRKFLRQTGNGTISAAPAWDTLVAGDIPDLSATYALKGLATGSGLTMATSRLLGRTTASTGAIEELSAGTSLSLSAGTLNTIQGIRTTDTPQFAKIGLGAAAYTGSTVLYGTTGSAGTAPTWAASDLIIFEALAGTNVNLQLFSDSTQGGGLCFTRPGLRSAGRLAYQHASDTMQFQVNASVAASLTSTLFTSPALQTGNPSGGTATPWKLGSYTAGTVTHTGTVRIDINGTPYDVLVKA